MLHNNRTDDVMSMTREDNINKIKLLKLFQNIGRCNKIASSSEIMYTNTIQNSLHCINCINIRLTIIIQLLVKPS